MHARTVIVFGFLGFLGLMALLPKPPSQEPAATKVEQPVPAGAKHIGDMPNWTRVGFRRIEDLDHFGKLIMQDARGGLGARFLETLNRADARYWDTGTVVIVTQGSLPGKVCLSLPAEADCFWTLGAAIAESK